MKDLGNWRPTRTKSLRAFLEKTIHEGEGYNSVMALRQNIAYNIQYLQFIDQVLSSITLTDVLEKQNIKTFVVVGSSIVESIFTYLLVKTNNHKTTKWEELTKIKSNRTKVDGQYTKAHTILYKKMGSPKRDQMTFHSKCKSVENNEVLNVSKAFFPKLNHLRKLRNKIHLQDVDELDDTDWKSFDKRHLGDMALVLYEIFTSDVFDPTDKEKEYFSFMLKYLSG